MKIHEGQSVWLNPFHLLPRSSTGLPHNFSQASHCKRAWTTNTTYISVMFSLSCAANAGMLLIPSGSRHWSMAKEQRQALGHPLRAGATRTRSITTTAATLRSTMVRLEWVCYPAAGTLGVRRSSSSLGQHSGLWSHPGAELLSRVAGPRGTSQSEMGKRRGGAKQSISWVWVWDKRKQWSPDTSVTLAEANREARPASCRWTRMDRKCSTC